MAAFELPAILPILPVQPEECLIVFRNVKVASPDDPALVESFRSNAERGKAPRREEITHPILHRAISCWTDPEANRGLAELFPGMGAYIACLTLTFGHEFAYMDPSVDKDPEHRRIWGDSAQLASATTEIFSV